MCMSECGGIYSVCECECVCCVCECGGVYSVRECVLGVRVLALCVANVGMWAGLCVSIDVGGVCVSVEVCIRCASVNVYVCWVCAF